MAWPEDNTKPKPLQPSPIMQRANRAAGRTFKAAADVADKYAGGAGMKQGAAAVANTVTPAINRIAEDAKRNTMARQVRNLEIPYGDQAQKLDRFKQGAENRQYGQNQSFGPNLDASENGTDQTNNPFAARRFAPVRGGNARESLAVPSITASQKKAGGSVMLTNRFNPEGEVLGNLSGFKKRDQARRFTPQPQSPYSVQFDDSVSPEARARFMQDPVRPTAQINRFKAQQQMAQRPQPLQPPEAPDFTGMTAPERRFAAAKFRMEMDRYKALIGQKNTQATTANERSRIDIERDRTEADIASKTATTEAARAGLPNAKAMAGLEAELLDPDTTPERREEIQRLRELVLPKKEMKSSRKPITKDIYGRFGDKLGEIYGSYDPETDTYRWDELDTIDLPNSEKDLVVGQIYNDADGNNQMYLGDGKFEPVVW